MKKPPSATAAAIGSDPVTYAVAALATSVVSACPPGLIESIIKTARALRVSLRERLILPLQLGEQADIFDRNGRLVGECLDEVDLLVRERMSSAGACSSSHWSACSSERRRECSSFRRRHPVRSRSLTDWTLPLPLGPPFPG